MTMLTVYVLPLPFKDGALPEPELVMESKDRDALKEIAHELAKEVCEAGDPVLLWSQRASDDEELIVEGHCRVIGT